MNANPTENSLWKELVIIEELRLMKLEALLMKATKLTGDNRNDPLAPIAEWIRDARQASANAKALEAESTRKRYQAASFPDLDWNFDFGGDDSDATFGAGLDDNDNPFNTADEDFGDLSAGLSPTLDGLDTIDTENLDEDLNYRPDLDWTSAAFDPEALAFHLYEEGLKLEDQDDLPKSVVEEVRKFQEENFLTQSTAKKKKTKIGRLLSLSKP